jgi:hypothetical protein
MKASVDAFEPISLGFRRQSIWWQWTAPQNGIVRLDTLQSDFDTVLVVYAGEAGGSDPFAGLDEVAASNNVLNSKGSSIAFRTEAGRVYQIMVDGYPDSTAGHGNAVVSLNQAIRRIRRTLPSAGLWKWSSLPGEGCSISCNGHPISFTGRIRENRLRAVINPCGFSNQPRAAAPVIIAF